MIGFNSKIHKTLLFSLILPWIVVAGTSCAQQEKIELFQKVRYIPVEAQSSIECRNYQPKALGVKRIGTISVPHDSVSAIRFRAYVTRIYEDGSETFWFSGEEYSVWAKEIAIVFQSDIPNIEDHVRQIFGEVLVSRSQEISYKICREDTPLGEVPLYAPFHPSNSDDAIRIGVWQSHLFEHTLSSNNASSGATPQAPADPTKVTVPSESTETSRPSLYSWAATADLKAIDKGESVVSIEKIECSDEGNFFLFTIGRAMKTIDPATGPDTVPVVRLQLYAANNYPGTVDVTEGRVAVENSLDVSNYWCIPKREFCYEEVEFGGFGLDIRKGRTAVIPLARAYNSRLGIVTALERSVLDHCPALDGRTAETK